MIILLLDLSAGQINSYSFRQSNGQMKNMEDPMREIGVEIKYRVIRSFLAGLSYDEIAGELGISKGSVVNIIDDFRNGQLGLPKEMNEYIDELRRLIVDMKRMIPTLLNCRATLGFIPSSRRWG